MRLCRHAADDLICLLCRSPRLSRLDGALVPRAGDGGLVRYLNGSGRFSTSPVRVTLFGLLWDRFIVHAIVVHYHNLPACMRRSARTP